MITLVITNETLNVLIGSDTLHQKLFDLHDHFVENHQVSIHTAFCDVTLLTNATIDVYFESFSFFIDLGIQPTVRKPARDNNRSMRLRREENFALVLKNLTLSLSRFSVTPKDATASLR
jgi:hypothetical protein